jgi:hypothetical protein
MVAAHDRQKAAVKALLDETNGNPVGPPPLELNGVTQDMYDTLLKGLWAALDNERDPFGIAPPRGTVPALTRQESIEAVAAVLNMRDLGQPIGAAIVAVADRYPVSEEMLRKLYEDDDIRGWADIQRNAYPSR